MATQGWGAAGVFTAPEPTESVYFVDYLVTGNIGVRAIVCKIGRDLRIGGTVQRVTSDAVRIKAASPDSRSMIRFTAQVVEQFVRGSVQRTPVHHSRDAEHIALSMHMFRSYGSTFQHRSGNDGDEIPSCSGSSSSCELHGSMPGE
jgi:acylphosphatase